MPSLLTSLSARTHSMFRSAAYPRLLLTGAALIPIFTFFYTDYSAWYNLGQGGAPRNPFGYLLIKLLGAAFGSSDLYSTGVYDVMRRRDVFEEESFLEGRLDRREGSRPRVSRWVAPVRQLSGGSPEEVKEALARTITSLAQSESESSCGRIEARASDIEGGGDATYSSNALHIILSTSSPPPSTPSRTSSARGPTEIYHFHPIDGSAHTILSASDAKAVLEAGWGERHPLSGMKVGDIPITYVMVYAPRTVEEVGVHERVARAAIGYAVKERGEVEVVYVDREDKGVSGEEGEQVGGVVGGVQVGVERGVGEEEDEEGKVKDVRDGLTMSDGNLFIGEEVEERREVDKDEEEKLQLFS